MGDETDSFHLDREIPFFTGVTVRETLAEECPVCRAQAGERCGAVAGYVTGMHRERIAAAQATKKNGPRADGAESGDGDSADDGPL